jgi:hypothetical protein
MDVDAGVLQDKPTVMSADAESKIKDLCAQAIKAEGEELQTILSHLRAALREQTNRARDMVAEQKRRTAKPLE